MSTIVVDAMFRDKLLATGGVAEFRDESGALIGRFIAAAARTQFEEPELGLTEAEVQRRLSGDCKTYSTAEVLSHLRGRT